MKIALIGYGKMGKMIEQIALDRGHEIVSIIDIGNQKISTVKPLRVQMSLSSLQHRRQPLATI